MESAEGVDTGSHNLECLFMSFNMWKDVIVTYIMKIKFPRSFNFCYQFELWCSCDDQYIIIKIIDWAFFLPPSLSSNIKALDRKKKKKKKVDVSTIFMKQSLVTHSMGNVLLRLMSTTILPGHSLVT